MGRAQADAFILDVVRRMPDGEKNYQLYKEVLPTIDQAAMTKIVEKIEAGLWYWPIFVFNMDEAKIDVDKVMAVGESIGVTWFQPLVLTDHVTGQVYETPVKYLVLDTPVRRQIQHLISKISTGEGHAVDHLGGQATGDAKASSVSLPELTQLDGRGFQASPIEFIKVRGGDEAAYKAMEQAVAQTGGFSLGPIMEMGTKPKAVQTLRSLLLGMHLRPTGLD
jgi:hypothetical protein